MDLGGFIAYLLSFIIMATIYAIFTLGLNLQWGYTGLFNVGLAGFFAIGAYASAILTAPPAQSEFVQYIGGFGLPFVVGLIGAGVVSGFMALLIGVPTLRLREDYLAIATIGIAETIRLIFNNERWLANGSRGLVGIPQPLRYLVAPEHYNYIYLVIAVLVLVVIFFAIERAIHSPWGRVLRAIREDEITTAVSGKNVVSFKMQVFVLGSVILGMGGAVYAHYIAAISPDTFKPLFGTFITWVMLMAGGCGNNKGAILGAFVVWGIWSGSEFVANFLQDLIGNRAFYVRLLTIGLLLEAILLLRPTGLLGEKRVALSQRFTTPARDESNDSRKE